MSVCPAGAISYEFAFVMRKDGKKGAGKSCVRPEPKSAFGRFLQSILEPQKLFVFSAFTFGAIMSGSFVTDALRRIAHLVAGGL